MLDFFKNKNFLKFIFFIFLICSIVFVLFFIVGKTSIKSFISTVEKKTFDIRQRIVAQKKHVNKDIVLLSIDDNSYEAILEQYGEWPMPRDIYADMVEYLQKQNPKIIAFDLIFVKSLKSSFSQDKKLVEIFKKYDNVYTSINFDNQPYDLRTPVDLPNYLKINLINNSKININNSEISFLNCRPILEDIIKSTSKIGHINLVREDDGLIREVPLFVRYKNEFYPHLAFKVALKYLGKDVNSFQISNNKYLTIDDIKIPITDKGTTILNWYGESGRNENSKTYTYIPMWKVLKDMNNGVNNEFFKDKIIYIGTSATSLYDIKSVPTERYLPGVELHATLVNNIVDNSFIKRVSLKTDILICLFLSLIVMSGVLKIRSTILSSILVIFIVSCYLIFSILIMQYFNLWIGIVMPVVSVVFVFIVIYLIKYILKSRDFEYTYKLATTDGLTELYNHRYFQEQMISSIENAKRYNLAFSLILIDIDFFKKFNDKFGHQSGDAVLKQVAQVLKKNVRSTDIVCRYGGEEMAIILTNTNNEEAFFTANKICQAVSSKSFRLANNQEKNVTISLGVATYPENGETPSLLIEYADKCLYHAKENGRNQVGKI